jgi:hypothetical protein
MVIHIVIDGASASAATSVAIALRHELWPSIWSTMMTSLRSGTFQTTYKPRAGTIIILSHPSLKSHSLERAGTRDTHSGILLGPPRPCIALRPRIKMKKSKAKRRLKRKYIGSLNMTRNIRGPRHWDQTGLASADGERQLHAAQ